MRRPVIYIERLERAAAAGVVRSAFFILVASAAALLGEVLSGRALLAFLQIFAGVAALRADETAAASAALGASALA